MKKILVSLGLILFISFTVSAQDDGGFKRLSLVERIKLAEDKIDSAFKLEPAKKAVTDSAITSFYIAMDAKRQAMMSGDNNQQQQPGDRMEAFKKLMDDRDAKLKTVLTDAQYKTWKEQIEPSLRGGGRGQGQNRFGGGRGGRWKNNS
ncbi:MAG: hypothetical protein HY252_08625 [Sphingobacteriales bacterium]|nr:hypothetical protein [Sphingobacteriales bacterium]